MVSVSISCFILVAFLQWIESAPVKNEESIHHDRLNRIRRQIAEKPFMPTQCGKSDSYSANTCLQQVKCLLQNPAPSVPCKASSIVFTFGVTGCGQNFYLCIDNQAYLEQCPQGSYFNNDNKRCEPVSPGGCVPTTSAAPETTTLPTTAAPTTTPVATTTVAPTTPVQTTTTVPPTTTFTAVPSTAKLEETTTTVYYPPPTTTEYKVETTTYAYPPQPSTAMLETTTTQAPTTTTVIYTHPQTTTQVPTTTEYYKVEMHTMPEAAPTPAQLVMETTSQYAPYYAETTTSTPEHTAVPTTAALPAETTTEYETPCPEEETTILPTTEYATTTTTTVPTTTIPTTVAPTTTVPTTVAPTTTIPTTVAPTTTVPTTVTTTTMAAQPSTAALEGTTTRKSKCPYPRKPKTEQPPMNPYGPLKKIVEYHAGHDQI